MELRETFEPSGKRAISCRRALRMRDAQFSSKAYGTHDYKEITIDGRVQLDLLLAVQRDHKLSSYSLNAVRLSSWCTTIPTRATAALLTLADAVCYDFNETPVAARRWRRTFSASRRRMCTTASSRTCRPAPPRRAAASQCTASRCEARHRASLHSWACAAAVKHC